MQAGLLGAGVQPRAPRARERHRRHSARHRKRRRSAGDGGRIEPGHESGILTAQSLTCRRAARWRSNLNGGRRNAARSGEGDRRDRPERRDARTVVAGTVAFDDPLVIVKNDGAGAVTGTFAGLAEGAIVFPSNGRAVPHHLHRRRRQRHRAGARGARLLPVRRRDRRVLRSRHPDRQPERRAAPMRRSTFLMPDGTHHRGDSATIPARSRA